MSSTGTTGPRPRAVTGQDEEYLPPMGRMWLQALYDPFTRLLGIRRVHRGLVRAARVQPGHRVLDIGCGTGNLALLAKAMHPDAVVAGLDPDFASLARARRKTRRRRLAVQWDAGSAAALPYPDGSVDRVLSAFMLHHVPGDQRAQVLAEVRRVLVPDGELHLVDFGGPHHGGPGHRTARSGPHPADQAVEGLPDLLRGAGFSEVAESGRTTVLRAPLIAYRAVR